jgi:hypothetical protein
MGDILPSEPGPKKTLLFLPIILGENVLLVERFMENGSGSVVG